MSSEVKRYDPINSDGTCGMCIEDADYGAYVEYADYAALEAENARLVGQLEQARKGFPAMVEYVEEIAQLRAQLAAIQGGMGDEPLVVATAILGGLFHGGSGPELGDIDIEVCTPHLEKIQCETVDSSDDVFMPLMTVAQHQRITAAMAAEVETWRSNALMLEQANVGLAQLNGKLRAELAEVKGREADK